MKALRGITVCGLVAFVGVSLLATAPAQDAKTEKSTAAAPAAPAASTEKKQPRFAFEMRNKPWSAVFEWLSDRTGLPFISGISPPPGTFSFINPRINGVPKEYTIGEIIDIINDGLLTHKYILLRRPTSFTIVPADEKIPPDLIS